MKKPVRKVPSRQRNLAAKSLSAGHFQPKVEPDPKAYKRRPKHRPPLTPLPPDDAPQDE